MTIRLRLTTPDDIPFVYELEHAPENSAFLIPWTKERHQEALTNPDILHLIVEKTETGQPAGYAIIAGLTNSHDAIELLRITVATKGEGYGRSILREIKRWAFTEKRAHRSSPQPISVRRVSHRRNIAGLLENRRQVRILDRFILVIERI
ncbi:GNAT family N-acetyltransferase [Brevibacillus sp. SIMBA_040]|uniref:GNAT family N-acetyltransferase n=1 Tax=unclassified Brevibacillus TaxID=2684853 RepID=UPI003979A6A0